MPCVPLFRLGVSSCVSAFRLALRPVFTACSWDTTRLSYWRRFALLAACRLVLRSARRFYPCLLSCVSSRCVSVLRAAIASRHCVPFSSLTSLVSVRLRSSPFVIRWWRFSCGAVSFCCSLIFIRSPPRCPARFSLFPSFSFSYVRSPWRLACRLVLSSRHAVSFSCVPSVVPPVVLSARPVSSSRLVASYGRRFVLLFARSRLAWAWRSCLAFSCRLVFSLASRSPSLRPVVSFRSSSHRSRLVLVPSSRHLCLPVGVSCPFSCLVPVFAPFRFAVRSFLTHSIRLRSSVPVSMRRGWGRHGHGSEAVCSRRLIRPLIVPARYSLTRCGMTTGKDGYGAPFHVARRSSIACSCRIVPPIPSVHHSHCVLIPSPTKQENERDGDGGDGERGIERDVPTRRNDEKPDETRTGRRRYTESKQATRRPTRRKNTRRKNETPL